MKLTNILRFAGISTLLFAFAGIAAAQGPAINTNTTTSELEMSANVQTAVQLNISSVVGGASVTGDNATGLFAVNFGNLNGLGLGTFATGVSLTALDGTGALYTTPINLTPVFSGFDGSASVTIEAGASADQAIAREGATAGGVVAVDAQTNAFSGAASESLNTRYVGFRIDRTELAGAKEATFIYTVTVDLN
jgi:hypothetical protein